MKGKKTDKKIPFAVVMLGLVSFFTDTASEMIYPLVPVFVAALGSGAIMLGVIEGIAETTAAMLKLISGMISDKLGKRKILVLIGYAISSFIRPLTGAVTAAWQIVFVRMFDRVGKGIRTAPRDALIAVASEKNIRGRSYGFHRAMDHAGAVVGPVLALTVLLILFIGFRMNDPLLVLRRTFYITIIPGILAILTIIFFVREHSDQGKSKQSIPLSFRKIDKNYFHYLLTMIVFTLGNSSDAFLLFRVEEAVHKSGAVLNLISGIPALEQLLSRFTDVAAREQLINILFLPFLWAFFHLIKVIFSTPLGALSDKIGRKKVILIGWSIYSFVYMAFALIVFIPGVYQVPVTLLLFAVYALYYAFTEGAEKAFVADLVGPERLGTAFGLYNFSIGLSALPASVIFGAIYHFIEKALPGYGGTIAFGFGTLLALISMGMLRFTVKENSAGL